MSLTVCAVEQEACFSAQHHGFARFDQRVTPQYLLDQYQQYNTVQGMCWFVAGLWQHLDKCPIHKHFAYCSARPCYMLQCSWINL